jgi:hypothetical protein
LVDFDRYIICAMKPAIIGASLFSISVSGFPSILKRQFRGNGVFSGSPIVEPIKYDETAGTLRPNSRHVKATYGPYEVIPGEVSVSECFILETII